MAFQARSTRFYGPLFSAATKRPTPSILLRRPYLGISAASSKHSLPAPTTPNELLPHQRLNRPIAPHLGMYKWQITSVMSVLTRLSGIALGGTFYGFAALYAASPWLGLDLSSAHLAAALAEMSDNMQMLIKTAMAWPFWFHSLSGVRYLTWDMTLGIENRMVVRTGWVVVVGSFLGALLCGVAI